MKTGSLSLLFLSLFFASSRALEIEFDYTYDTGDFFPAGSERRAALEAAGDFYSDVITDSLAELVPVAPYTLEVEFRNPTSGSLEFIAIDGVAADTIIIYVGARDLAGDRLGSASFGGWYPFGNDAWLDLVDFRGQTGDFFTPNANEVSTWGGSIAFDTHAPDGSAREWDTSTDGSAPDGPHLFSIAVHEIAHVLGFGLADSWFDQENGNTFEGEKSQALYGGPVPLEAATPAHWEEDIFSPVYSTGVVQESAMDAILDAGTTTPMTLLDLAGLDDIGWDITPPPPVPVAPALETEVLVTGEFSISWQGDSDFDYQVEAALLLNQGWAPEGSAMPGIDGPMSFSQGIDGAKHFRVKVTPKESAALMAATPLPLIQQPEEDNIPAGSLRRRIRSSRDAVCNCHAR